MRSPMRLSDSDEQDLLPGGPARDSRAEFGRGPVPRDQGEEAQTPRVLSDEGFADQERAREMSSLRVMRGCRHI